MAASQILNGTPIAWSTAKGTEYTDKLYGSGVSGTGSETRTNRYDANGRLLNANVAHASGDTKHNLNYSKSDGSANYDAAGNLLGYQLSTPQYSATYTYNMVRRDAYKEGSQSGTSSHFQPGSSTSTYDAEGNLVAVTDSTSSANNRSFVNDAAGRILAKTQGSSTERQMVVNGEVLGRFNASSANFNFGFTPISGSYPAATPGTRIVSGEDSLQSIAKAAYGDSSLWYLVAEANGMGSSRDLRVGQTLTLPTQVGSKNNVNTFKPYDPSAVVGDTSPNLPNPPPPKQDKGCGGLGQLIMIVVAVAATVMTAGAGAVLASGGTLATATASQLAVAGIGAMGGTFGVGIAMGAAAAGSIASQVAGNAMGVVDGFSWKNVALSAIGGGVTAGVGQLMPMASGLQGMERIAAFAGRAAVVSAVSQGIGVVTGLQEKFNWKGVAASAVGAAVGQAVAPGLEKVFGADPAGQFATRFATGLVAGTAAAAMQGGKVVVQQIATDAFGNALGSSLADQMASPGPQGAGPWSAAGYENGLDIQDTLARNGGTAFGDDALRVNGLTFSQDMGMRRQASDPLGLMAAASDSASVLRRAQALWGPMPAQAGRYLSDTPTDAELMAYQMQQAGDDRELLPMAGGSVRVTPGAGGRPAMVNGVSVNERVKQSFEAADDLLGMGQMYRDYKLLGGLMNEGMQNTTLDKLKGALQDKLGMMRVLPSESDLGAVKGISSDGSIRYNNADLIDRYGDALRKAEMWKQGIVELDTRSMLITSVGNQRMSPAQWVEENTNRYQKAFAAGVEDGQTRYTKGTLPFPQDMPQQLQIGIYAHQRAELAIKGYNLGMGVSEGPGQLLVMNRWAYDPSGSGLVGRPDMLLDLGSNRPALVQRFVVDGKSSMAEAMSSIRQFERDSAWLGGAAVKAATPQGLFIPRIKGR